MATIGSLAVNIVARTDKFVKGINQSRTGLQKFSKSTQNATKFVTGFVGAFTAGVGIYGITRSLQAAAAEMDSLAKTSDKLGVASERLAGLHHAASQTGVSTTTLNMALQRMVRRVAEAAQGTGEAVKALKELGLDAKELNDLAPDETFRRVAEEMSKVGNQSDKVRLAMKLFDSEGVSLVNTLALGADGLASMQREAEQLGTAFSREELKKVEEFNDALDSLGKAFKGSAGKILIDIAPAATSAIKLLGEAATGIRLGLEEQRRKSGSTGMIDRMTSGGPGTFFGMEDPWLMALSKMGPKSVAPAQPGWTGTPKATTSQDSAEPKKAQSTREKQLEVLRRMEEKMVLQRAGAPVPTYAVPGL